jgi:hypothetical protein
VHGALLKGGPDGPSPEASIPSAFAPPSGSVSPTPSQDSEYAFPYFLSVYDLASVLDCTIDFLLFTLSSAGMSGVSSAEVVVPTSRVSLKPPPVSGKIRLFLLPPLSACFGSRPRRQCGVTREARHLLTRGGEGIFCASACGGGDPLSPFSCLLRGLSSSTVTSSTRTTNNSPWVLPPSPALLTSGELHFRSGFRVPSRKVLRQSLCR